MTECYEFEGKTVEKAIQSACRALNVPKESLTHEVISFGSSGIFGLVGARKARIRVCNPVQHTPSKPLEAETAEEAASVEPSPEAPEGVSATPADVPDDVAQKGREIIEKIIDTMTTGTTVRVSQEEERLRYNIEGGELGIMIGKGGQTLAAIHYLVEKIINKNFRQRIRIDIDVGGYLSHRRKNLRQLALRMAQKARQSGKPATVGQMNAHDRRVIHLMLKDDATVRTQSVGQGQIRKLMIFPNRRPQRKNGPSRSTS